MSTPSPYLRDRLLQAADGLRKDAETARLNLADADQDVAAARALLAEAEAHAARARAEVDGIEAGIAWAEAHAATITREIDADPAAKLRATGLMRHEPIPAAELPGMWEEADFRGGQTDMDDPRDRPATCAEMGCTSCLGCDGCTCHDPDGDLPFNVVQAPADVIAAITGGTRVITDEPPRTDTVHTSGTGAGQLVATSGPTVTMPDTGLNPAPLPPADVTAEARHARPARPKGSRLTGPLKALISKPAQDGDDQ